MDRITQKHLDTLCARINKLTGSPSETYTRDADGRLRANVGNYHISSAYGGVCLHRMVSESGGVSCPLNHGYTPKRELYNRMHAFISGIELAK